MLINTQGTDLSFVGSIEYCQQEASRAVESQCRDGTPYGEAVWTAYNRMLPDSPPPPL